MYLASEPSAAAAADWGAGLGAALRGGAGARAPEGGADWQPGPSTPSKVARPRMTRRRRLAIRLLRSS